MKLFPTVEIGGKYGYCDCNINLKSAFTGRQSHGWRLYLIKIAFDIDGVVLRSIDVILDHINESTGSGLKPDDLTGWDLEPLGLSVETLRESARHMFSQDYIEPYEGAITVLSEIYDRTKEPLLFITGRNDPGTARRQLESLDWPVGTPEMIVTGGDRDKRFFLKETGANFIIEDDELHLMDYMANGVCVGLMVQPWNRKCSLPVTCKFDKWNDIRDFFIDGICESR